MIVEHTAELVLVVDDDPPVRAVLTALLEASGYAIVGPAENAKQAIEITQAAQPAAVLMDMRMPGMSGLEATPLLLEACPTTRVILLTGLLQNGLHEAARAAGVYACLPKGDSWAEIRSTLHSALSSRAPTQT